ncbi:ROK family protein [Streptomyces canus]|uniref:ROK family protein n=1 Tax=Streptomyces canus TaxID=58343 RepID=UPI0036B9D352
MTVPEPERVLWPLNGAEAPMTPGAPAVVGVADLRATNAAAVLAVVRSADPHPRLSELVKATSLSRPTVEAIAEELAECGLIEVAPALSARGQRSPGRPARRFRFRPHAGFVVGVDVRPRSITASLADLDGEPVAVHRLTVRADISGRARAQAVVSAIRSAMTRADVDTPRIWAATIGTPGLVDRSNTRVRQADNLPTWADTDIVGILREELRCPVAVENDANLAALGEQWHGGRPTAAEGPRADALPADAPPADVASVGVPPAHTLPAGPSPGGTPPADPALADVPSVGVLPADALPAGPSLAGTPPADAPPADALSADTSLAGTPPADPALADVPSVGVLPADALPAGPSLAGALSADALSADTSLAGTPPADPAPADVPSVGVPPADTSPTDPPPATSAEGKTGEMLFVLLGERLGAGVITGGRLLRGHHGAAGEIGFIRFPGPTASQDHPDSESAPGSRALPDSESAPDPRPLPDPEPTPGLRPLPDSVITGAAAGDPEAVLVVEGYGRRLAAGLAPVLLALDPALVVLGTGPFGTPETAPAAALMLNAARDHAAHLLVDPPSWQLSTLGDEAVLTGAVRFALSSVEVALHTRPTSLMARVRGGSAVPR